MKKQVNETIVALRTSEFVSESNEVQLSKSICVK